MDSEIQSVSSGDVSVKPVLDSNAKVVPQAPLDTSKMTFEEFMQTELFVQTVAAIVQQTGKPEESVIAGLTKSVLGTISDTSVRGLSTVENFVDNITEVVSGTIKGLNKTVFDLAKDTVRTVTLGKGDT